MFLLLQTAQRRGSQRANFNVGPQSHHHLLCSGTCLQGAAERLQRTRDHAVLSGAAMLGAGRKPVLGRTGLSETRPPSRCTAPSERDRLRNCSGTRVSKSIPDLRDKENPCSVLPVVCQPFRSPYGSRYACLLSGQTRHKALFADKDLRGPRTDPTPPNTPHARAPPQPGAEASRQPPPWKPRRDTQLLSGTQPAPALVTKIKVNYTEEGKGPSAAPTSAASSARPPPRRTGSRPRPAPLRFRRPPRGPLGNVVRGAPRASRPCGYPAEGLGASRRPHRSHRPLGTVPPEGVSNPGVSGLHKTHPGAFGDRKHLGGGAVFMQQR